MSDRSPSDSSADADTPWLPEELRSLVRDYGVPLVDAVKISPLAIDPASRSAFRLHFADGTILKGRRLSKPRVKESLKRIVRGVGQDHFAKIIAERGPAMLEEWVAGPTLQEISWTPEILQKCGDLLGRIHEVGLRARRVGALGRNEERRLATFLKHLTGAGALTDWERDDIWRFATTHTPIRADRGDIHRDFCPENLVQRENGAICCIDNTTVKGGPFDIDLARTWFRWPMTGDQWREFLSGYTRYRPADSFLKHFPFWATRVLVNATFFRVSNRAEHALAPLEFLLNPNRTTRLCDPFHRLD